MQQIWVWGELRKQKGLKVLKKQSRIAPKFPGKTGRVTGREGNEDGSFRHSDLGVNTSFRQLQTWAWSSGGMGADLGSEHAQAICTYISHSVRKASSPHYKGGKTVDGKWPSRESNQILMPEPALLYHTVSQKVA